MIFVKIASPVVLVASSVLGGLSLAHELTSRATAYMFFYCAMLAFLATIAPWLDRESKSDPI